MCVVFLKCQLSPELDQPNAIVAVGAAAFAPRQLLATYALRFPPSHIGQVVLLGQKLSPKSVRVKVRLPALARSLSGAAAKHLLRHDSKLTRKLQRVNTRSSAVGKCCQSKCPVSASDLVKVFVHAEGEIISNMKNR